MEVWDFIRENQGILFSWNAGNPEQSEAEMKVLLKKKTNNTSKMQEVITLAFLIQINSN